MNYSFPQYYKYIVLFKGEINDVDPIIYVSDLPELKLINRGRMHLFDELLIPILPALDYCLHMPRTELDICDTEIEVLD